MSTENYSIPQSCCRENNCTTPERGTNETIANEVIFTRGCSAKAIDLIEDYFTWIFVATIIVVILQVMVSRTACGVTFLLIKVYFVNITWFCRKNNQNIRMFLKHVIGVSATISTTVAIYYNTQLYAL